MFAIIFFLILPTTILCIEEAKAKMYRVTNKGVPPTEFIGTIKIIKLPNGEFQFSGTLVDLTVGKHGFHIHTNYSIGNSCIEAGGHLNLNNNTHGSLTSTMRHEGDLGNIITDSSKITDIDIKVNGLDFDGSTNLLRRTLVVHEGVDDLGLGNHSTSLTTGNSGGRVACGLITSVEKRPKLILKAQRVVESLKIYVD